MRPAAVLRCCLRLQAPHRCDEVLAQVRALEADLGDVAQAPPNGEEAYVVDIIAAQLRGFQHFRHQRMSLLFAVV